MLAVEDPFQMAFLHHFEKMTQHQCGDEIRSLVRSGKKCKFEDLQVDGLYVIEEKVPIPMLLRVFRLTPKKTQATFSVFSSGEWTNIQYNRSNFASAIFYMVTDELAATICLTHREIVEEAIKREIYVHPTVRVEYPDLFVKVPERFEQPHEKSWLAITAVERVRKALAPQLGKHVNPSILSARIKEHHRKIASLREEAVRVCLVNPNSIPHYEEYVRSEMECIDLYSWLMPHVDIGGVFHVESNEEKNDKIQNQ